MAGSDVSWDDTDSGRKREEISRQREQRVFLDPTIGTIIYYQINEMVGEHAHHARLYVRGLSLYLFELSY
jgi:hypothetical protein